jgi:hypothetical protein
MAYDAFKGAPKVEMKSRTFHLEKGQLEPLRSAAKAMGISQSEVVRRAINLFIDGLRRRQQRTAKNGR